MSKRSIVKSGAGLLLESDSITLPAITDPFDPFESFKSHNGVLRILDGFRSRILPKVLRIEKLDGVSCSLYRPRKVMWDSKIVTKLPQGYEWDLLEACGRVAQILKDKPMRMAYGNYIFYVPDFVITLQLNFVSLSYLNARPFDDGPLGPSDCILVLNRGTASVL